MGFLLRNALSSEATSTRSLPGVGGWKSLSGPAAAALEQLPWRAVSVPRSRTISAASQEGAVHIVTRGILGRAHLSRKGTRQLSAIYLEGDAAGLSAREEASFVGLTDVQTISVSRSALLNLMTQLPEIALTFIDHMTTESEIMARWLRNLGRLTAAQRVGHFLCEMAIRRGSDIAAGAVNYKLQLTQMDIADITGLTSVHVNRVLHMLRECGLVSQQSRRINISDFPALARLANFDAGYLLQNASGSLVHSHHRGHGHSIEARICLA